MTRQEAVCDVCGGMIFNPDGYLLTTTEIVSSPAYWKHYYESYSEEIKSLGIVNYDIFCDHPIVMASIAQMIARQYKSWRVCESCIGMFCGADRNAAHRYAARWWDSGEGHPDEGMAPSGAIQMRDPRVVLAEPVEAHHN